MFERHLRPLLTEELQHTPAVALRGPRQSGTTRLAWKSAKTLSSIHIDQKSKRDRAYSRRLRCP